MQYPNILYLPNVPDKFYKTLQKIAAKYTKQSFKIIMSDRHHSSDLEEEDCNILNKFLPMDSPGISFNLINQALETSHIDRQRKTALQIAVQADPLKHFAYAVKNEYLNEVKPLDVEDGFRNKRYVDWENGGDERPMFYHYNPCYNDHIAVKPYQAYLCNTTLPHGGLHTVPGKSKRLFFSFSFLENIDDVKIKFKDWM